MIHFLYNISVKVYAFLLFFLSAFNSKANLWIAGRKNLIAIIKRDFEKADRGSRIVWFHCASLGEFEQGRPLIEKLKVREPNVKIVLTFFSPSGYEIQKKYSGADYVYYLPADTPSNAKEFIETIKPSIVFFVKYEFWFNYLNELKKNSISTYLVSGIFREDHYFFKSYGSWFLKQLQCFTHFYLQSESAEKLLNKNGYLNTTVCGDTRFDRVFEISKKIKQFPLIEKFKQSSNIFIAGSTWLEDEKKIASLDFSSSNTKLIIAPHEIDENHIKSIESVYSNKKVIRYSASSESNIEQADVLIVDSIGMLSSLYQYGSVAYIGGGFGKGIHNIIEAATFGMPVIFGPNYQKFIEAKELVKLKGAFSISSIEDLQQIFKFVSDRSVSNEISQISRNYVSSHVGASERILNAIDSQGN